MGGPGGSPAKPMLALREKLKEADADYRADYYGMMMGAQPGAAPLQQAAQAALKSGEELLKQGNLKEAREPCCGPIS